MNLQSVYRFSAKAILTAIFVGIVVGISVLVTGCSTTETKVEPIPIPIVDYDVQILGTWEGINGKHIEHGVRFDFKPNHNLYIYVKQNDEYIKVPADGAYNIYDNKILHMTWTIKKSDTETVSSEEFWHVTITGKVMYLSVKKLSKDGESYVVTLTMKKVN